MHKQKWYADLTQNQLGIWYMIWKFISKKTLGREAIKIMTLVNTPKGEQNSLASCSPFTDLIKSINIYNHIHIDDQYMYPVWYTQLQCYRANSGPLLMKLFRWNHQFFWSQTAPEKSSIAWIQSQQPQTSRCIFSRAWKDTSRCDGGRSRCVLCGSMAAGFHRAIQVYFNKETDDISSARRYINVVNSMS